MTTPLLKVMAAYCNRQGILMDSVTFHFSGVPIAPHQTPAELGIEDGGVINLEEV